MWEPSRLSELRPDTSHQSILVSVIKNILRRSFQGRTPLFDLYSACHSVTLQLQEKLPISEHEAVSEEAQGRGMKSRRSQ